MRTLPTPSLQHLSASVRPRLLQWLSLLCVGLAAGAASYGAGAQTIKIGAPLALSGGLADEGKKQQAAYELWLERINAAGGIEKWGRVVREAKLKVE